MHGISEFLVDSYSKQLNAQDLKAIVDAQQQALQRFEKTNEMLANFNTVATCRFSATLNEMRQNVQLLTDMKSQLDTIFRRTRSLKRALGEKYPLEFRAISQQLQRNIDEEDEEAADDAPAADAPATDAPATDAPATDAPATDALTADAPVAETPAVASSSPPTHLPPPDAQLPAATPHSSLPLHSPPQHHRPASVEDCDADELKTPTVAPDVGAFEHDPSTPVNR